MSEAAAAAPAAAPAEAAVAGSDGQCDPVGEMLRAMNFAAVKHTHQRRKDADTTPYINHPLGVAHLLYHVGGVRDVDVLVAGVLHDTVEDTETSNDELRSVFGPRVASMVAEVTDDKSLDKAERKRLQVEHAASKSSGAKQVKLADKLYNCRDLETQLPIGWSEERRREYFQWAAQVVAGLRGACAPLEARLDALFQRQGVAV